MKILPVTKYKYSNDVFVPDVLNSRRLFILLTFAFTLIASAILVHIEDLIISTDSITAPIYVRRPPPPINPVAVAIEQYITTTNTKLDTETVKLYAKYITTYSNQYNVDPFLLTGLISVESRFDRYAISSVGALGLTQVLPKWHKKHIDYLINQFGTFDLFEPEHNIALGARIFAEYKMSSHGSKEKALLKYNGSLHHDSPTYAKLVFSARQAVKKGISI